MLRHRVRALLGDPPPVVPSVGEAAALSPEQVAGLFQEEPGFVWLDGGSGRHLLFRRPFAGLEADANGVRVWGPHGEQWFPGSALDVLDAVLTAWEGAPGPILVGWVAYEAAAEWEQLPFPPASEVPRMRFAIYDSALIRESPGRWLVPQSPLWSSALTRAAARPLSPPQVEGAALTLSPDAAFSASVARIVERIYAGDFFQTNLCRRLEARLPAASIWPLYRRMRALGQPARGAFLQLGNGRAVLSMSPETFLETSAGRIRSLPIKGTRPRGRDGAEDAALLRDLQSSEKDRAELAMVVDVTRNDLSRVCQPGSVQVEGHAALLTLPTVHHTQTGVTGQLRPGVNAAAILRAAFPPASITGAPKLAAMEAAWREEQMPRGVCMGAIGWLSLDGGMELSVAIRTAYAHDGRAVYLAGCGITADSDPAAELAESQVKAAAFLQALGLDPPR
ncbi:MAG TPA: anthranilate synthase component I family protein [Bryobacteraceae bacterium]|nr:anthranilate synthase component I family protein [Bryobacteraceae bacterium]